MRMVPATSSASYACATTWWLAPRSSSVDAATRPSTTGLPARRRRRQAGGARPGAGDHARVGPGRLVGGQRPDHELASRPGGEAVEQPLVEVVGEPRAVVRHADALEVLGLVGRDRQPRVPVVERGVRHPAAATPGRDLAEAGHDDLLAGEVVTEMEPMSRWDEPSCR